MKTIFTDLQGTLGGDPLGDITEFTFYPEAIKGLKLLHEQGFRMIIVTNQSRISKGYLSREAFEAKTKALFEILRTHGIEGIEMYCCPHTQADNCVCKKPLPGLFEQANQKEKILPQQAYMIGDMGASDMLFAHKLGMKKVLVLTGVGEGSLKAFRHLWDETEPEHVANHFYEAAQWIVADGL